MLRLLWHFWKYFEFCYTLTSHEKQPLLLRTWSTWRYFYTLRPVSFFFLRNFDLYLFIIYLFIYLFNVLGRALCSMWDLSSLSRGWTCAPCIGSMDSWPLDHQGSPWDPLVFSVCVAVLHAVFRAKYGTGFYIDNYSNKWSSAPGKPLGTAQLARVVFVATVEVE